ncbi:hypothetical protein Drorol1_Dr00025638 [Drosera rotundifolia]
MAPVSFPDFLFLSISYLCFFVPFAALDKALEMEKLATVRQAKAKKWGPATVTIARPVDLPQIRVRRVPQPGVRNALWPKTPTPFKLLIIPRPGGFGLCFWSISSQPFHQTKSLWLWT